MDFHAEFDKSINAFPGVRGIIFADPDGESILFENPKMDSYNIRLTGAQLPIMMQTLKEAVNDQREIALELIFDHFYFLHIKLEQCYSISAIGTEMKELSKLKQHLRVLAEKFNEDII